MIMVIGCFVVLPEGRKIRTFSESQEMERQLEEEEQRRAAGAHWAAGAAGVHGGEIGAGDRYQGSTGMYKWIFVLQCFWFWEKAIGLPDLLLMSPVYQTTKCQFKFIVYL